MNYKKMTENIRKEIICGIENAMADIKNDTAFLFTDRIDSTTYTDKLCGEVYHIDGFIKTIDGGFFFTSEDNWSAKDSVEDYNTEDLGAILDALNAKEYEVDED